ncbi:hypothetical protein [Flavobacterium subsaxonicum]|uniref:Uncharacterized protein n=1 Tax=Flavobacterium subsaxonicum WB 4.1-42 = DSM 21790 TaxID=1121898 RepID=A0A0A2MT26_9FLAO|nr:hypothetical protein [Flavobacterium subsaxonicum]KGO94731.1 hypothetical protein Q766_01055 [Flavobacterium subsaxonicum WB 4.1-42 = DSM 21790]
MAANYLIIDYRFESLSHIINGLKKSIENLELKLNTLDWYDGLWLREESEPVYGLAFIAFQNYINSTIKDITGFTKDKTNFYKINGNINGFKNSQIELIIGLANYIKHKDDDGLFHVGTKSLLKNFNLNSNKDNDIDNSAIFGGLSILDDKWNLDKILTIVILWRKQLYDIHSSA